MPHLDHSVRLDFKDVLIRPKRSTIRSRADVSMPSIACKLYCMCPLNVCPGRTFVWPRRTNEQQDITPLECNQLKLCLQIKSDSSHICWFCCDYFTMFGSGL